MLSEKTRFAISHLNKHGFETFIKHILTHSCSFSNFRHLSDIDERIVECPPERYFQSADAFILNYHPTALYRNFSLQNIDMCELEELVTKYLRKRRYSLWLPTDGTTIYTVNNYDSRSLGISDERLLEYYETKLNRLLPAGVRLGLGNVNTYLQQAEMDNGNVEEFVSSFFKEVSDGLSICVSENGISASTYLGGNEFPGITSHTHSILHPVIKLNSMSTVLKEFNTLLNSDAKEQVLEDFMQAHYKFIFGEEYDCIATQLWIKFPEFDIGNSDRRLDIFMRNSITSDWDLFELKRPSVQLTKTVRDVPTLTSEVNNAIAQVKNYKHLLSQDSVRRKFEKEGIEYFQPEIHLVIGRRPEISNLQWRRIIADESSLRILTYDNLYKAAEKRLKSLADIL